MWGELAVSHLGLDLGKTASRFVSPSRQSHHLQLPLNGLCNYLMHLNASPGNHLGNVGVIGAVLLSRSVTSLIPMFRRLKRYVRYHDNHGSPAKSTARSLSFGSYLNMGRRNDANCSTSFLSIVGILFLITSSNFIRRSPVMCFSLPIHCKLGGMAATFLIKVLVSLSSLGNKIHWKIPQNLIHLS